MVQDRLENQILYIMSISADRQYTEYLNTLLGQYRNRMVSAEYAQQEVNRTWNVYQQRMLRGELRRQNMQPMQAAQGGFTQPVQGVNPQAAQGSFAQPVQGVNPQTAQGSFAQPVQGAPAWQPAPPQKKNSMEFTIGAGLLSVVGVVFVLVAFVMLGITYMDGFVKGMCLYGMSVVILLVSELLLRRKMPKFAVGITALGICGMYASTMINCSYLQNFNGYWAMGIAVAVSILALVISRKRDSGVMKVISFIGCYVCAFPIRNLFDMPVFAVVAAIMVLVNLMTVFLPVKRSRYAVDNIHCVTHMIFTLIMATGAAILIDSWAALYYLLAEMAVHLLILYRMSKAEQHRTGALVIYFCTQAWLLLLYIILEIILFHEKTGEAFVTAGIFFAVCLLGFLLFRKGKEKWFFYLMFVGTTLITFSYFDQRVNQKEDTYFMVAGTVAVLGVFLLSKCLSRIKYLQVSEIIITLFTAIQAIHFFVLEEHIYSYCFLGAFLLSLFAVYYFKQFYEETVLLLFVLYIIGEFHNELQQAVVMALFFMGTLAFNCIPLFKSRYTKVINYINLGLIALLYFSLLFSFSSLNCILMLIIGIAYLVVCFQENFGMNFRIKHLITVGFLCYMTLVWKMPFSHQAVIKSIILMVIAIGTIVMGFLFKEKKLRIGGLILTLSVCAKLALYDFPGAATTEKMILFMVAGVIVLAISAIYIALEKSLSE